LLSPLELLLEPPIESEMLPDDAEPALDADEATLSAWAGRVHAAAASARASARVKVVTVIARSFLSMVGDTMVQVPRNVEKARVVLPHMML
jgi:hypothetical protein